MNFGDFLHSKRWKLMQNYIYSWGASVVLIGALFKMEHLKGSSVFLGVGLSIEAIIFFVSAFEPLMELPDWKAVYPQLRTGEEKDRELKRYEVQDERYGSFFGGNVSGGGTTQLGDIPPEQLNSLKESLDKLTITANGLKDITDSSVAADGFVKNLNEVAQSIGSVAEANKKASMVMEQGVQEVAQSYKATAKQMGESSGKVAAGFEKTVVDLSDIYASTADDLKNSTLKANTEIEKSVSNMVASMGSSSKVVEDSGAEFAKSIKQSANELTASYKEMTGSLTNGFKGLEKGSATYVSNLDKLNKNLSAINTAYELHLKGTSKVEVIVNEYSKGVDEIGKLLHTSVEETKKFNQNTKEINENIQALNNIYGRMLGALNGKR